MAKDLHRPGRGLDPGGRRDRAALTWLFALALCVYLLTAAGHIVSEDGTQMFNVTRSLVRHGDISIPWGEAMEGRGGKLYARYGIAASVAAVPFYAVGWGLASFGPSLARENPEFVQRFAVSMTNPVVGALCVALMFLLGRAVGFSRRTAVALSLALGFCTFAWAGAKYFVSEPVQGLFMVASFLVLLRSGRVEGRSAALSGALLGLGFIAKPATIVAYPAFAAFVLLSGERPREPSGAFRRLVAFSLPFAAAGLLSAAYNYYRFADPVEFGFGFQDPRNRAYSTPLGVGLYGLLLSSGKSVFLYAPTAILMFFSLRSFFRRNAAAALVCVLTPAALVVLHAKWVAWHGDGFWGPRYLMSALPFMILPVGALLDSPGLRAGLRRAAFAVTVAAGLLVQIGGVTVSYASYFRSVGAYPYKRPFYDPLFMHDVHFDPAYSPVLGHWRVLAGIVTGRQGWSDISLEEPKAQSRVPVGRESAEAFREGLDIWYVHFYRAGVPVKFFGWAPALLLVGTALSGARLKSALEREGGAEFG